jgi:hypothetical protein
VTVGARLDAVQDAPALAALVAEAADADVDDLLERLRTPGVLHVDLVRQLDPDVVERLRRRPGTTA